MCGRFTNDAKPNQIEKEFDVKVSDSKLFTPRYNIAPSDEADAHHAVKSIYARNDVNDIKRWIENGKLRYLNTKKVPIGFKSSGYNCPCPKSNGTHPIY